MKSNPFILFGLIALSCSTRSDFRAIESKEGFEIREGNSRVLFYQKNQKSLGGKYARADYVHPLYNLKGNIITEDFPEDHPHHRGIFWAWHQILIGEKPIADGWSCENITWDVVETIPTIYAETIHLDNEVLWKSVFKGDAPEAIVREYSQIKVHRKEDTYRLIDFDITIFALADSMKIGGSDDAKGYSGFSLRFKLPADIRFLGSEKEVIAQELALTAGPWLDFAGSFDGLNNPESGVAVFSHPSNPGHPQPWILRKEKSMQNPAFPGRVPIPLTKEGIRFQYRLVIHADELKPNDIEKLYQAYGEEVETKKQKVERERCN